MVVVGIGMNGGLVRQVALEWDGKGQGTQWPNMDLDEVWCGSERELRRTLDRDPEKEGPRSYLLSGSLGEAVHPEEGATSRRQVPSGPVSGADTVQTPSNVDPPVSFESVRTRFCGSGKFNLCTYLISCLPRILTYFAACCRYRGKCQGPRARPDRQYTGQMFFDEVFWAWKIHIEPSRALRLQVLGINRTWKPTYLGDKGVAGGQVHTHVCTYCSMYVCACLWQRKY